MAKDQCKRKRTVKDKNNIIGNIHKVEYPGFHIESGIKIKTKETKRITIGILLNCSATCENKYRQNGIIFIIGVKIDNFLCKGWKMEHMKSLLCRAILYLLDIIK